MGGGCKQRSGARRSAHKPLLKAMKPGSTRFQQICFVPTMFTRSRDSSPKGEDRVGRRGVGEGGDGEGSGKKASERSHFLCP